MAELRPQGTLGCLIDLTRWERRLQPRASDPSVVTSKEGWRSYGHHARLVIQVILCAGKEGYGHALGTPFVTMKEGYGRATKTPMLLQGKKATATSRAWMSH